MTSFIITATSKDKRKEYVMQYCQERNINTFDITIIEKDTNEKTKSIGIEDIKLIQKKIFFKPLKSPVKAVIIEDAQLLTTEAQNALLKVLEEPPEQTIIILAAETKESLLPTIISRCQIIMLEEEKALITEEELTEYREFFEQLPDLAIGERLKKAEVIAKDKDQALAWIGKGLLVLREELVQTAVSTNVKRRDLLEIASLITSFQSLHTMLKTTNVNPRFAIEHTLLTLQERTNIV